MIGWVLLLRQEHSLEVLSVDSIHIIYLLVEADGYKKGNEEPFFFKQFAAFSIVSKGTSDDNYTMDKIYYVHSVQSWKRIYVYSKNINTDIQLFEMRAIAGKVFHAVFSQ